MGPIKRTTQTNRNNNLKDRQQEAIDKTWKNNMADPQQESQDRSPEKRKNSLLEPHQGLPGRHPSRTTQQNYRRKKMVHPQQELVKPTPRPIWQACSKNLMAKPSLEQLTYLQQEPLDISLL